jgi:2,3-dihydroxybenzoate-AMP ligase
MRDTSSLSDTLATSRTENAMLEGCVPWPEELAERYRREGYWRGERLGDLARSWGAREPHRTALVTDAGSVGYGELDTRAERLAAGLRALGIAPRDRVVVALGNGVAFVSLSIALFRLGAIPVYALPMHRRSELEYLCRITAATALVVPDAHRGYDFRPVARDIAEEVDSVAHVLVDGDAAGLPSLATIDAEPVRHEAVDPGDVAFFLLSGGTTGMPKLIPRTHDDYAYQLRCSAEAIGAGPETVYLAALPAAHNAALGCPGVLGTLRLGGRVLMASSPAPTDLFTLIERERPTLTTLMPTFLQLWVELAGSFDLDLSGLTVEVGGAKLDPDLARAARRELGCTVSHWFGMAEGVLLCTRPEDPIELAATTQGRTMCDADELRIVDDTGTLVAPGETGELLVRGPMTLRGYYRAPEYNAARFTADGFLQTGDLVRFAPGGNLQVVGRLTEVINRGGEKVSPGEVEDHLRTHPAVRDVALVALPDPRLGERSCAFVIATGDTPALADLREHLSLRGVADYKLPDRLVLVDTFPLTKVGKIDKLRLRESALIPVA